MAESRITHIDQIAAANLARDLGITLDLEQLSQLERHLADHRTGTIDIAMSRLQSKISDAVHQLISGVHAYRSNEWSDGCRSVEAAVLVITSDVLSEIRPREPRSQGQILRNMLHQARRRSTENPQYNVAVRRSEIRDN